MRTPNNRTVLYTKIERSNNFLKLETEVVSYIKLSVLKDLQHNILI